MENKTLPRVAVIMGSSSDAPVMQPAVDILKQFGVETEFTVVSAHRSPEWMFEFAKSAEEAGFGVVIAGAGGAAHLPGMVASLTALPVIGVPVKSSNSIDGWDSVLSILQMPNGVPVATVALNAAQNAGLLAIQMLAIGDAGLRQKLHDFKAQNRAKVEKMRAELSGNL